MGDARETLADMRAAEDKRAADLCFARAGILTESTLVASCLKCSALVRLELRAGHARWHKEQEK